jgi:hypothetical protein
MRSYLKGLPMLFVPYLVAAFIAGLVFVAGAFTYSVWLNHLDRARQTSISEFGRDLEDIQRVFEGEQ